MLEFQTAIQVDIHIGRHKVVVVCSRLLRDELGGVYVMRGGCTLPFRLTPEVSLHMGLPVRRLGELLRASRPLARERLMTCVCPDMCLEVRLVCELLITAFIRALEVFLSGVHQIMPFQLRFLEESLVAALVRARELPLLMRQ